MKIGAFDQMSCRGTHYKYIQAIYISSFYRNLLLTFFTFFYLLIVESIVIEKFLGLLIFDGFTRLSCQRS